MILQRGERILDRTSANILFSDRPVEEERYVRHYIRDEEDHRSYFERYVEDNNFYRGLEQLIRKDFSFELKNTSPNYNFNIGWTPRFGHVKRDLKYEREYSLYENFNEIWFSKLGNLEALQDRQKLYQLLVEDNTAYEEFSSIRKNLSELMELSIHLSSMSSLISSNIVGLPFSAPIHKKDQNPFYEDFTKYSTMFIDRHNTILESINNLNPESRELKTLLQKVSEELEDESQFREKYDLLNKYNEGNITNYNDLRDFFREEIQERKITKISFLEEALKEREEEHSVEEILSEISESYWDKENAKKLVREHFKILPGSSKVANYSLLNRMTGFLAITNYFREQNDWTLPELLPQEEGIVDIKQGYFPYITLQDGQEIIKNDTTINSQRRIEILSGTNRGGKTTDMKKTASIVAMAMMGGYVPTAKGTRISYFDNIFFRVKGSGIHDRSAFRQELDYFQDMLTTSREGSTFLGIDEPFTSTNAREGEALTYGLVRYLSENPLNRGVISIHYPGLKQDFDSLEGITSSHFQFQEAEGAILTDHVKREGFNEQEGYAIQIARDEGLDEKILANTRNIMESNT